MLRARVRRESAILVYGEVHGTQARSHNNQPRDHERTALYRGMRLTVRRVVEAVALYPDRNELKSEYPELEDEDIAQALEFAARNLDDQVLPLEAA